MTMKRIVTLLLLIGAYTLHAQQYPEVKIPGSQIRKITSKIVKGQEYELQIMLPANYGDSTKKYPVVYLMDSQWDFPLVNAIYGEQYYDGFIPELILVGITWGGENPNPDVLRARDYTPTDVNGDKKFGGADKFLDFIKTELFPFIESNYYAQSSNRILMGCSYGGLFTMYTLFTHTDMFDSYVAATPALNWDNEMLYKCNETFSEKKLTKPISVYMTVGDVEMIRPYFEEFVKKMKGSSYKNVRLHSKVLENTGHSGTKCETYTRGLQYVFERNKLKLSNDVLNKYVGTYQLKNGDQLEIKNNNNGLELYSQGYKISLLAHSENHFYATLGLFNVHFIESNNAVNGIELKTYGGTQTFSKVAK